MLAIKINILPEININSSSSAEKREGTDTSKLFQNFANKTFHFKISCLASYFEIQGSSERKREKTFTRQWRNSKEKKA